MDDRAKAEDRLRPVRRKQTPATKPKKPRNAIYYRVNLSQKIKTTPLQNRSCAAIFGTVRSNEKKAATGAIQTDVE